MAAKAMTDRGERGPEREGYIAWGNGEPCPVCGKLFERADVGHLLTHPEAVQRLFPRATIPPEPPGPAQAQEMCLCGKPVNAAGLSHLCSTSAAQPVDLAREAKALKELATKIVETCAHLLLSRPNMASPLVAECYNQTLDIMRRHDAARRQSEEGLREAVEREREACAQIADAMWLPDRSGRVIGDAIRARAALEETPKP
jgi:hypothetical protein